MKIMSDEKDKEKDTPSEPSTEETNSETVTEDDKKTESQVPSHRLKEESDKRRKAEAELEALRAKTPKQEVRVDSNTNAVSERMDAMEAVQRGHNPKVIEEARFSAKARGISLDEALETPAMKAYADVVKSEEATSNATPATGRSPKMAPEKPMKDMSRDEHKDYFNKLVNG